MSRDNNKEEEEQQQQEQSVTTVAVDNFIKAYKNQPPERQPRFREAMFNLQRRYPDVFKKLWSNDQSENVAAVRWIKNRHDELAVQLGMELTE